MNREVSRLAEAGAWLTDGIQPEGDFKPDAASLVSFWRRNKCPLVALDDGINLDGLADSAEFRAALAEDADTLVLQESEYVLARDRWAEAGIRCMLIKSGGAYPAFPYTSDNLDVLVAEEHARAAADILMALGYLELVNIEEPHKYLYRKFRGGECVSAIHLHTWIGWNVGFLDSEPVWRNSRTAPRDEAVTAPSPEDIILINIAHAFYENKRFRLGDIIKMRESWRHGGIDWQYMEQSADRRGWLDGLHFCLLICTHLEEALWGESTVPADVREGWRSALKRHPFTYRYYQKLLERSPVSVPFVMSFPFSKLLYYQKVLRDRRHGWVKRVSEVVRTLIWGVKLKGRIRPQPGFLISFSGPDGSGKTQHARALIRSLRLCGLRTGYYWSRCGSGFLVTLAGSLFRGLRGQRSGPQTGERGAPGRSGRLRNPVLRFLWAYLVSADMALAYFFRVRIPLLMGAIVVCDRYVYDAAAEMLSSLPEGDRHGRLAARLMVALSPTPDVAYMLDVPEEVSAERKDENTALDYLRGQRGLYDELADRHGLLRKRTERDFGAIADEILVEVLPGYYRNFATLLNGLFMANARQLNPQFPRETR